MATNKQIEIDLLIKTAKSVKSTEAQKAVLLDIYDALKKVEKGSTVFDTLSEAADGLKQSLGGVNASFEDIYGNVQPLTSRLGELEDRMYELALAGQQNTQEFKDLQAEAIKMRKTIIDVDDSIDAFAQKGAKIQALSNIVSGLAGAFGSAQAAVGLLGGNTDGFEKSLLKLQQVMMIMQGVQEVSNLLTQKNVVFEGIANFNRGIAIKLIGAKTVATAQEAVATGTATVAQRALNLAMSANPIGLIIVAVTALVGAYYALSGSITGVIDKQEEQDKKLEQSKSVINSYNDAIAALNDTIIEYSQATTDVFVSAYQSQKSISEKELALLEVRTTKTQAETNKIKALKLDILKTDKAIIDQQNTMDKLRATQQNINNLEAQKQAIRDERDAKISKNKYETLLKLTKQSGDADQKELDRLQEKIDQYDKETLAAKTRGEKLQQEKIKTDVFLANADQQADIKKRGLQSSYDTWLRQQEEAKNKVELDIINGRIQREEDVNTKLKEINKDRIVDAEEKEKAILDLEYGSKRDVLIKKVVEREIKALDDKYVRGEINEKKYQELRKKVVDNGVNSLIESEKKLLEEEEKRLKDSKSIITEKYRNIKEITIAETNKINAELVKLEIETQKKLALSGVKTSVDPTTAKEKLKITQKNLDAILEAARVEEEQYNRLKKKDEELIQKAKERVGVTEEQKNEEIAAIEEVAKKRDEKFKEDKKRTDAGIAEAKRQNEEVKKNTLSDIEATKKSNEIKNSFKEAEKKANKELADAELELLREKYESDISLAGLTTEEKKKIDAQYALDRKTIETRMAQESIDIENDIVEKKIEKDDKLLNYKKQLAEDILSLERTIQDTIMSFIEQETNERLKQNDLIYQDKISKIDAEEQKYQDFIANRTIAEQTAYDIEQGFADQRKNAERTRQLEEDKIKKKAFEAQKINDATSVAINYGVAIAKAFKDFGWPFGLIPAAFLGVQLGIEEAAILNKKYIPQYARGGIHFGDGIVSGPGTGTSDDINAKLSNGEVVINAKSSKKFAPILSAINEAGGGKKIPHFAGGGVSVSNATVSNNTNDMSTSINTNIDLQPLIDAIYSQNREIYVKESTVTNAQNSAEKLKRRTRF